MIGEIPQNPDFVETKPLRGKLAVVTGTSRGIGAEIAKALASAGCDIVGTHVDPSKAKRQEKVAEACRDFDTSFISVLADISERSGRLDLIKAAFDSREYHGIDILVLNAAGGLEEGKGNDWAERINVDSQFGLVNLFLPFMSKGSQIIYLTSLWAHNYGATKQLALYEPVARTKKTAEDGLRNRIPELEEKGITLGILVGDLVKGTAAYTVFKFMLKEKLAQMEQSLEGGFPSASDMGRAVVEMVLAPHESGYTKYVGRSEVEPFDTSIFGRRYERSEVAAMLPMYTDETLFVDSFTPSDMNSGTATYRVRDRDVAGHFAGDYADIKLLPGHILTEGAMQSLGLVFATTHLVGDAVGVIKGAQLELEGFVFPNNEVRFEARIESYDREGLTGSCDAYVTGELVGTLRNARGIIIPSIDIARRLYRQVKAAREKS